MATQIVKYYTKTSYGKWTVRKSQVQDDTYGVDGKPIRTPHTLGLLREDGKLLLGNTLLLELKKPIWGDNNDQLFSDLIPDFPAKVPEKLVTDTYQWFSFDPDNPETYPKSECPPDSPWYSQYNGPRGWECENKLYPGMYYQNMHWFLDKPEEMAYIWKVLNIWRYRQQADPGISAWQPNPEYPIVEAQRAEAGRQWRALVERYLIPVGSFQFQGLPLNTATVEYQWDIDGVRMTPDPKHKLANGPGGTGWKMIPTPLRNPEIITVNTSNGPIVKDLYDSIYQMKTYEYSTWDISKDAKIAYLTK